MMRLFFICAFCLLALPTHALRYVLDTEINGVFRAMLMELDPDLAPSVKLHLGLSPEMNAFVTTGNRMFIFSGLIEKTETAAELQGVLAHELAHLKAGHLEQGRYAQELAQKRGLLTALLGIGTAIAGAADAAGAVLIGGQAEAISGVLRHSRTAENEADNIAAQYLTNAGYSLDGMVNFFRKLHSHTQLRFDAPPSYLLTHPLPAERVDSLTAKLNSSSIDSDRQPEAALRFDFARFKGKVYALSHTPNQVLRKFNGDDTPAAHYARAVAYALQGQAAHANAALAQVPASPFVTELRGDIALDTGDLAGAYDAFKQAQAALNSPLIAYKLAQVTQAQGQYDTALAYMLQMFPAYSHFAPAWQLRGVIAGQAGRKVESHLALAEAALRNRDVDALRVHLQLAERFITESKSSAGKLQLESLRRALENMQR